jgi:uncharacterized protein (DUF2141 family)
MRRSPPVRFVAALAIVGTLVASTHAWQTRDGSTQRLAAGTAVLAGRVVADAAEPSPQRRATVTLSGGQGRGSRETLTDDQGRFTFAGLPAGSYALSASKTAWLTTYYGSRHPGVRSLSPAPLTLADGEQFTSLELKLLHGSAITGVVLDQSGRPADVQVEALQFHTTSSGRRLVSANYAGNGTDDRGVYRLYELAPGSYVIKARRTSFGEGPLYEMTPDVLQSAQKAMSAAFAPAAPADRGRAVKYNEIYYPGTADPTAAAIVQVGANEEKSGVDFVMQLVPTARIAGRVLSPDGQPLQSPQIQLVSAAPPVEGEDAIEASMVVSTERDGSFVAPAVATGQYIINARAEDPSVNVTPASPMRTWLWGAQDITLGEQNLEGITVRLQPGLSVTGRVTAPAGTDVTTSMVLIRPAIGEVMAAPGRGTVAADGAFTVAGLAPGKYQVAVTSAVAPQNSRAMKVASASSGGHDVADLPMEIRPGQGVSDLAIKVVDQLAEISGTLRDKSDNPAAGYVVAVFSADRAYWRSKSRRMPPPTQTSRDGRFRFTDLPAGTYFIITAADLDPDTLQDPAVLEQLGARAQRITLAEGEKQTVDLTISDSSPTSASERRSSPRSLHRTGGNAAPAEGSGPIHSALNACTGSTRLARRDGINVPTAAVDRIATTAVVQTRES